MYYFIYTILQVFTMNCATRKVTVIHIQQPLLQIHDYYAYYAKQSHWVEVEQKHQCSCAPVAPLQGSSGVSLGQFGKSTQQIKKITWR
jgi:hypothetical protein